MLLIELASKNPEFIETYYSNGIYLYLSKFLRIVLGWLPFSAGDLLMVRMSIAQGAFLETRPAAFVSGPASLD